MILGHSDLVDNYLRQLIFSFHMPMFFILSGMFYHPKPFRLMLNKVFRSLLVPFIIMTLLWILYYLSAYIINNIPLSKLLPYIIGSIISPGHSFFVFNPLCVYLWFIMALAIIKIFACFCYRKIDYFIVSTIFLVVDYFLIKCDIKLPFALNSVLLAMPYFSIGYIFSPYLLRKYSNMIELSCLLICITIVIIVGTYNGIVDMNKNLFGNNLLLFYVTGMSGSLAVFSFSKLLTTLISYESPLINVLSNGTLLMVGFSARLNSIYVSMINLILPFPVTDGNVKGFIIGLLVLLSCYPLTILSKKYFPAIIGFRK